MFELCHHYILLQKLGKVKNLCTGFVVPTKHSSVESSSLDGGYFCDSKSPNVVSSPQLLLDPLCHVEFGALTYAQMCRCVTITIVESSVV